MYVSIACLSSYRVCIANKDNTPINIYFKRQTQGLMNISASVSVIMSCFTALGSSTHHLSGLEAKRLCHRV